MGAISDAWPGFGVDSVLIQVKNDENLGVSNGPASESGKD
jgi:hypothetical protein